MSDEKGTTRWSDRSNRGDNNETGTPRWSDRQPGRPDTELLKELRNNSNTDGMSR